MKWSLVMLVVVACGGSPKRHETIDTAAPSEYPGVLVDPSQLSPDFSVRQTLVIKTHDEKGKPVTGEIDAVLQKQGPELLIVGLGPANVKAFTLTHRAGQIEFKQFYGPKLPFSPRNVVVDVHRVFFKRLPVPTEPTAVVTGEIDGEHVEETWRDGQLRTRVFTRPTFKGVVRVELGDGCTQKTCEPVSAKLTNEWFDYTIEITNDGFEAL